MIKYVIFDMGQVLVDVKFEEFMLKFARAFKANVEDLKKLDNNGAYIDFMEGKLTGEEFHKTICKFFNFDMPIENFRALWLKMLGGQNDDTVTIVNKLAEKKYPLAILSNIDSWHFEFCMQRFKVLSRFNNIFASFQLKMKKPDENIFRRVAEELQIDPEHCFFIDDRLENVESAKKVGFQSVQFTDAAQLERDLIDRKIL